MSKPYGLIVPNKSKPLHPLGVVRPSIFGDDSDSDSGSAKPTGLKTALKRQDRLLQEKAVEEDPTVFQYDELYDDMSAKRKESKLSRKDLDKKPKYISKLLVSAERRKRENERRIERQVQKEREAEGEEFKDKESFVTSAYRAKLEELKKLEEEERREEYLESIGDVKKQGNLDGFYRHLYDQKVLYEDKTSEENKPEIKTEHKSDEDEKETEAKEQNEPEKKQDQDQDQDEQNKSKEKTSPKKRKYRKRGESSESEPETVPNESARVLRHLPSNIDADSDFSIDSSDSDEESEVKKPKAEVPATNEAKEATGEVKVEKKEEDKVEDEQKPADGEEVKEKQEGADETKEEEVKKPKIDIWKKRTVGDVFDEALKRYFERKSLREAGTYVRPVV